MSKIYYQLLSLLIVIVQITTTTPACVPPPAVECKAHGGHDCTIFNAKGIWPDRGVCRAGKAAFPSTEEELVEAVAEAVKNKRKIKVISAYAHSTNNLFCVGDSGVIISTLRYASRIEVDKKAKTVTVDSGAIMRDVIDAAAKEGLALPAMIYWEGASAGGVISTGSHGSGVQGKGSAVHEYVVGMRIVVPASASRGYAKVITLTEEDPELKAARLSLGTLGAISQITFALQPMFKRSVTYTLKDDSSLEDEAEAFLRSHEFADLFWILGNGKAVYGAIDRVSVEVPGNGVNQLLNQPTTVFEAERDAQNYEKVDATEDSKTMCNMSLEGIPANVEKGLGFLNDEQSGFIKYPVVGFNHRMQTAGGCQASLTQNDFANCKHNKIRDKNELICAWDRRVNGSLEFDVEIRIPLWRARDAIIDVKRIRDLNPSALCELDLQGGMAMRTVKKSEAYLAIAEDVVAIELQYLRHHQPNTPKWNMDVYQEIEQLLMQKYEGTLHWGKSGGVLFREVANRTVNIHQFLKVKDKFDEDGLFSNDWTDEMLGIGKKFFDVEREGGSWCALEKMCICRDDKDCGGPENGYFCRGGRVWKKARVCRKLSD